MTDHETNELRRILQGCDPSRPPDPGLAHRARSQAVRMQRHRRAAYGAAGVVVAAAAAAVPLTANLGSSPDGIPKPAASTPPGITNCPVTQTVPRLRVPAALRGLHGEWVGAKNLWIQRPNKPVSPGSTGLKFATFTLDERGHMSDAAGAPTLTAQRLDGHGRATGTTPSYSSAAGPGNSTIYFWPTTIQLPSPGCWALTTTVQHTRVRFIMQVGPATHSTAPGTSTR